MNPTMDDLLEFVQAIEHAFPHNAPRDKFGRYSGPRNTDPLRLLAIKWGCAGDCFDTQDQAGRVARAMLDPLLRNEAA